MRWALGVELRRGRGWVVALGVAAATVAAGRGGRLAGFWQWSATSNSLLVGLLLVAPLAAAAGAWWSSRDRRVGVASHLDAHARPPAARELVRLGALGVWVLIGHVVGTLATLGLAAFSATAGAPRWAPLAVALLVPQAAIVLGAAVGRLRLPPWATAAVAASGLWSVGLLGAGYGEGSLLTTIGWLILPAEQSTWLPATVIDRQVLLLVAGTQIGLVLLLGAAAVARRPVAPRIHIAGGVGAIALAVSLGGASVTDARASWTDRDRIEATIDAYQDGRAPAALDDVDLACETARGVEVCVMAAWQPLLQDVVGPVSRTLEPIAQASGTTLRAEQALYPAGLFPVRDDGTVIYQLPFGGSNVYLDELPSTAALGAVSGKCGGGLRETDAAQSAVARRLVARVGATWRSGFQRPDDPEPAPADDALVAWLAEHLPELRACNVAPDELPDPEARP